MLCIIFVFCDPGGHISLAKFPVCVLKVHTYNYIVIFFYKQNKGKADV